MREEYPNFSITRKIRKDGCKYFGPYMGGINCKDILDTLQLTFCIRLCHTKITGNKRECLNYHIGRCLAPCAGKTNREEYVSRVKKAISFLDGNYKEAETLLKNKMLRRGRKTKISNLLSTIKPSLKCLQSLKLSVLRH